MNNPLIAVPVIAVSFALAACASKSTEPVSIGPRWTNTANVALMPEPPDEACLLSPRSRVELLAESGAFAKIQTADGLLGYVPAAVLDSEPPRERRRRAARPAEDNTAPQSPLPTPDSDAPAFRL